VTDNPTILFMVDVEALIVTIEVFVKVNLLVIALYEIINVDGQIVAK